MNTIHHHKLTLHNADCMDIMRQFPDKHFDLAIVDPPYGIGRDGQDASPPSAKNSRHGGKKFFAAKGWDKSTPDGTYFAELFRVSMNQIIWGANYYPQFLQPSMGWIFWDKMQRDFNSDGELAFTSFQCALKVVSIQRGVLASEGTIHPTQKPVALYRWLLAKYAQPGQRILDTHLGSGSHAIAAHYAGMEFTGIELDPDYFAAAVARIKAETAQMTLDFS